MKQADLYQPAQDAGASVVSADQDLGDLTAYSVHVVFAGAGNLVGTLTLEASNDDINYVEIAGTEQAVSNSEQHLWNAADAGYRRVRVRWVYTSGSGTISAKFIGKQNTFKEGRQ